MYTVYMLLFQYLYTVGKRNERKTTTSFCLLQTEDGNGKLPLVFLQTENGNWTFVFLGRQIINGNTTFGVPANVPIYTRIHICIKG